MAEQASWLVAGLGNPGERYAGTRHNAGAMVADVLATRTGAAFRNHKSRCAIAATRLAGMSVTLAKPMSYMNESGASVAAAARFFRVPVSSIVVIHDELDLPFGSLRIKCGGGDGGHNGLKSVTAALRSNEYFRVRVGIGRPPGRQDPADYVLRVFSPTERRDVGIHLERAADAVQLLITDGLTAAQNDYND